MDLYYLQVPQHAVAVPRRACKCNKSNGARDALKLTPAVGSFKPRCKSVSGEPGQIEERRAGCGLEAEKGWIRDEREHCNHVDLN